MMAKVIKCACPFCGTKNPLDVVFSHHGYIYNPLLHFPFDYELGNFPGIYHCKGCRFTCCEWEIEYVYGAKAGNNEPEPVDPRDIQTAREVMSTFDFSGLSPRYKTRDLPKHRQLEIIEQIYKRGFKNDVHGRTFAMHSDSFFLSLYFLMGYYYHEAQMPEKSRAAFEKALVYLEKEKNRYKEMERYYNREPEGYYHYIDLYSGSINYFLGKKRRAIQDYEIGMAKIDRLDAPVLYHKNLFYFNSRIVLGPFIEHPLSYCFQIRNIFFSRYFNITFDEFLFSLIFWLSLIGLWILAAKHERLFSPFLPYVFSLSATACFAYGFRIHESLRAILFIDAVWGALFYLAAWLLRKKFHAAGLAGKLLAVRYKTLCWLVLLTPLVMFFFTIESPVEEIRKLFWLSPLYWGNNREWIQFAFDSLKYWIPMEIGVYLIHFLFATAFKKEKPGVVRSILATATSLALFWFPAQYFLRYSKEEFPEWFFLGVGTLWFILFLILEFKIIRPLISRSPLFRQLNLSIDSQIWNIVRFTFMICPSVCLLNPGVRNFDKIFRFIPFWGVALGLIYAIHVFMARVFIKSRNKLDYSLLTTILSGLAIYLSMRYWDNTDLLDETGAALYIVLGIWFVGFLKVYQFESERLKTGGGSLPRFLQYVYYNRLWAVVKFLMVILPIIYAVIWNENSYRYGISIGVGY